VQGSRAATAVDVDTAGMNPLRRSMAVARFALAVALVASACGGRTMTPGASGGAAGPGSATPAPIPGAPERPTGPTQDATLVRVVDGDTIRVMVGGIEERVRYIGIDTPELNTSSPATPDPYAEAATDANARLLAGGRLVLEKDVSERDQYGRLLRNVWVERDGAWTFVNLALVAEGFAQVSTYPPDVKYVDVLLAAQRAAREDERGLWARSPP
jgi:micrococcal nuclease